jgi:hypothetical protein
LSSAASFKKLVLVACGTLVIKGTMPSASAVLAMGQGSPQGGWSVWVTLGKRLRGVNPYVSLAFTLI